VLVASVTAGVVRVERRRDDALRVVARVVREDEEPPEVRRVAGRLAVTLRAVAPVVRFARVATRRVAVAVVARRVVARLRVPLPRASSFACLVSPSSLLSMLFTSARELVAFMTRA
jgi:hypothetical protein